MKSIRSSIVVMLVCLLVPCLLFASENLFRNSDMTTRAGWRGDRSFDEFEGESVLVMRANPRRAMSVEQTINTARLRDIEFKFRYRSEDYHGRGFQVRGVRQGGGATFRTINPKVDGEWQEYSWRFSSVQGSPTISFQIQLLEGEGSIMFTDITATPMDLSAGAAKKEEE